jgi:hypothetical protein
VVDTAAVLELSATPIVAAAPQALRTATVVKTHLVVLAIMLLALLVTAEEHTLTAINMAVVAKLVVP